MCSPSPALGVGRGLGLNPKRSVVGTCLHALLRAGWFPWLACPCPKPADRKPMRVGSGRLLVTPCAPIPKHVISTDLP